METVRCCAEREKAAEREAADATVEIDEGDAKAHGIAGKK